MATKRRPPELVYVRERSASPGSPEQLEQILRRWDLMLVRKARERLTDQRRSEGAQDSEAPLSRPNHHTDISL